MRPSMHEWRTSERYHDSVREVGVMARGLGYDRRRREANPNEGDTSGGRETSTRNMSTDDEEARLQGICGKQQGKPLYLREESGRRTACLDSHAIPSRQNHHIILPCYVHATDRPHPLLECVGRWINGHQARNYRRRVGVCGRESSMAQ
jgi:hypothetical protein